jgi:hypothetical protein
MIFIIRDFNTGRTCRDYFNGQETAAAEITQLDVTEINYTKILTTPETWTEDLKSYFTKGPTPWDIVTVFDDEKLNKLQWFEALVLVYKRRGASPVEARIHADVDMLERNERTLEDRTILKARVGPKKSVDSSNQIE